MEAKLSRATLRGWAAAAVILIAACSPSSGELSLNAAGPQSVTPSSDDDARSRTEEFIHPDLLEFDGIVGELYPIRWLRAPHEGRDDVVRVEVSRGGCGGITRVEINESDDVVEITVFGGSTISASGPCPAIVSVDQFDVALDGPLGDRELVDSAAEG